MAKKDLFKKNLLDKVDKLKKDSVGVYSNMPRIIEVDLDKLEYSPNQPRLHYDETKIEELANSIQENGLIQPILVKKDNDKYQIIAGHRRFLAFKKLNKESIPAIVKNNQNNEELITLTENLIRENLNQLEIAFALEQILEKNIAKNQSELAKLLGINESTISRYLKLLKLPNIIKRNIKDKKYSDLLVLNKLASLKAEEAEKIFFEILNKNLNRKESLELIANYNKKRKNKNIIKGNGFKIEKDIKKTKIEIDLSKIKDPEILQTLNKLEELVSCTVQEKV
jgi:ParB family chromosome partitioning protein